MNVEARNSLREWVKETLGLLDSQVIVGQQPTVGPRRLLPFLEVLIITSDRTLGVDAEYTLDDGTRVTHGERQATFRVTGYGYETADWIESLVLYPPEGDDVTIVPMQQSTRDISIQKGKQWEPRFMRDFSMHYQIRATRAAEYVNDVNIDTAFEVKVDGVTDTITIEDINGNP